MTSVHLRRSIFLVWVVIAGTMTASAWGTTQTFTGAFIAGGPVVANYSFTVSAPGEIDATLDWADTSANLTLAIVSPSGAQVALKNGTAKPKTLSYQATTTGTYKVRVKAVTNSSTSYTASVSFTGISAPQFQGYVPANPDRTGHAEIYPSGLDVGPDGTVYVADTGGDQVQAYAPDGSPLWTRGGRGTKALGRFNNPRDVAFAMVGGQPRLFVDDTGYNRVQVLDASTGAPVSAWAYRFHSTLGISVGVDGSGNQIVLVSEDAAGKVLEFDTSGNQLPVTFSAPVLGLPLSGPRDAATDSQGNVYVADYMHDRIVKYGPTGNPITAWGTHGPNPGQFLRPYGVDVDQNDNVYVADSDNNRIQEFTPTGGYQDTFGQPGTGSGDFQQLRRVAVGSGPDPDVYGADLWTYKIVQFDQTGTPVQVYGNKAPADGQFNEPSGMTFDGAGHIFVTDAVNQRIERFITATGAFDLKWGQRGWGNGVKDGFNWPRDITYAPATNTLWVADTKNNRMVEFRSDGTPTGRKFGVAGTDSSKMNWPYGVVAVGTDLIVADTINNRVERWTPPTDPPPPNKSQTGTLVWFQNIADGVVFKAPYDVAVSGNTVYVADATNKRIVVLNATTGAVMDTFGQPNLHTPQGVAVDPDTGNVWVSDTSFNRLVEFAANGTFLQAYGRAGSGQGQFNKPTHVEIDGGLLYVADTWNDRIQVFSIS